MTIVQAHSSLIAGVNRVSTDHRVDSSAGAPGKRAVIAGRCLSGFAVLFLVVDTAFKLAQSPEAIESTQSLGYSASSLWTIGLIELACLLIHLIPRTAVLGAVLWTGYLGGAIATHVRVENPLFSHVLFPIYVAAFLWAGLWLRDARVRALLSARR